MYDAINTLASKERDRQFIARITDEFIDGGGQIRQFGNGLCRNEALPFTVSKQQGNTTERLEAEKRSRARGNAAARRAPR